MIQTNMKGELWRHCLLSPLQASLQATGVVLVVAIQHFDASKDAKFLISICIHLGFLLGPPAILYAARRTLPVSQALALGCFICAAGCTVIALAPGLPSFVAGCLIIGPMLGASMPFTTALWRQNIASKERGRLFSRCGVISSIVALLTGLAISNYMGDDAGRFRPVFGALAIFALTAGLQIAKVPSKPLQATNSINPLRCLRWLARDRFFGYVSFVWYLMGISNLATIPLRTELAASPEHVGLTAKQAILLLTVLPIFTRTGSMFLWGKLFDSINFMVLRIAINAMFIISLLTFFTGTPTGLIVGSIFMGVGQGGGAVAWSLWVTKFSQPEHTAEYMAAHTFLTATRGILGPLISYEIIARNWASIQTVGWLGAALMFLSTLLVIPVISHGRRRQDQHA